MNEFTKKKEKNKKLRVILQLTVLLGIFYLLIRALFTIIDYKPYDEKNISQKEDQGFIALSYFGMDRNGTQTLISTELLDQHLSTLRERGYVTITQQDILDYYQKGKNLPKKALFLMFEDGRRGTAIFTQKLLEKNNFKATCLTYPEKLEQNDPNFLMPEELKKLKTTTYWEMGTNGYRLSFINVFDRYNNFLGNISPKEHAKLAGVLGQKYNYYLMDYIRDENKNPLENDETMHARVDYDYENLQDVYTKTLGYVPKANVLMNGNTGNFGNSPQVAEANKSWIEKLFLLNFNRKGTMKNVRSSGTYDLTRTEPQAYWSVNHLLTHINKDMKENLGFVQGDEKRYKKWVVIKGAAEMQPEKIILTTAPNGTGLMTLKESEKMQDFDLSVNLEGNKYGQQNIYLRRDKEGKKYVQVGIVNNYLLITDKTTGREKELLKLNLDVLDGVSPKSVEEDEKEVLTKELEIFSLYKDNTSAFNENIDRLKKKQEKTPKTISQGAKEYVPILSYHERSNRHLDIKLKGKILEVKVDGKNLPYKQFTLEAQCTGEVYLGAVWGGYGLSISNPVDDVYDGVFTKLMITEENKPEMVLYNDNITGLEAIKFKVKKMLLAVVEWFVKNL